MPSRTCVWLAALVLCGSAPAQAPTVSTDHYGPPTCAGVSVGTWTDKVAKAHGEQQAGAADTHALVSADPMENFDIVRDRIKDYYNCIGNEGCYWADVDAQYKRAEAALQAEVATKKPGEKLALVMDIDETALSGYCIMQRLDMGYIKPMFDAWVVSPEAATAIPGGVRLFNEAKANGIAVFFITGRAGVPDDSNPSHDADETAATGKNLEAAGYHGWAGLRLRNGGENLMSTIDYKASERARIVYNGYRILMSVGDQWSDLQGEPKAEVSIKLPNPFYFIP